VRVDRPPPGEQLNFGKVVEPRPAASLILLRDGPGGAEVLLVRRNPEQRFMGGAWVFPGGGTRPDDDDPPATARRELEEEAGLTLSPGAELVPFARWIAPEEVSVRFDTWFFAAAAPPDAEPQVDGGECVEARWLRPTDALAAHARGELLLVFPTIKQLERLGETGSVAETLEAARRQPVVMVQPRVVVRDGGAEVLLPGEPGYDDPR
jgi:8-oxo-dGTP pyrophosphatase MutT (NUDIX family)